MHLSTCLPADSEWLSQRQGAAVISFWSGHRRSPLVARILTASRLAAVPATFNQVCSSAVFMSSVYLPITNRQLALALCNLQGGIN